MVLSGLLGFPVTPIGEDGELDMARFERHIAEMLTSGPAALFVACGTGELPSLSLAEHGELVRAAVAVAGSADGVPVYAGAGGGTRIAAEFARSAERAGADGLLVLPPYLQVGPPSGLLAHYRAVAAATDLPLIPYQRATAVFTPEAVAALAADAQVVAFKDGLGDLELLQRIHTETGGELPLLNGMPTAETYARAYAAVGARTYSSATLAFAPRIARAFFDAYERGDERVQRILLREFYVPLTRLRHTTDGYAVALVKAGLAVQGNPAGPVRPPLADVTPAHRAELAALIDRGHTALDALADSDSGSAS
jgi:5-dehydro-4-deoxyglucarate dehydratase